MFGGCLTKTKLQLYSREAKAKRDRLRTVKNRPTCIVDFPGAVDSLLRMCACAHMWDSCFRRPATVEDLVETRKILKRAKARGKEKMLIHTASPTRPRAVRHRTVPGCWSSPETTRACPSRAAAETRAAVDGDDQMFCGLLSACRLVGISPEHSRLGLVRFQRSWSSDFGRKEILRSVNNLADRHGSEGQETILKAYT